MGRKVQLIRTYIQPKIGNVYAPGEYDSDSLPVEIRDNRFYLRELDQVVVSPVEKDIETKLLYGEDNSILKPVTVKDTAINLNTATLEILQEVDGIGDRTAKAIIKERTESPFKSIEEVKERVKGSERWINDNIAI